MIDLAHLAAPGDPGLNADFTASCIVDAGLGPGLTLRDDQGKPLAAYVRGDAGRRGTNHRARAIRKVLGK